jgi:WD40 repeat protein
MMKYILSLLLVIIALPLFSQVTLKDELGQRKHQIVCVAYSYSGQHIATAGLDGKIILWDAQGREKIKEIDGMKNFALSLTFSKDDKLLIAGSKDRRVHVWDVNSGQSVHSLKDHKNDVTSVVVSPDNKFIASASKDRTIKIWNLKSGQLINTLTGHSGDVMSIDYDRYGSKIVSGAADGKIKIWDAGSGKLEKSIDAHEGWIRAVAFSPTGNHIASGGDDNTIKIWNARNYSLQNELLAHSGWVESVVFSPDGKYLVSGAHDNILLMVEVNTGKIIYNSEKQSYYVLGIAFSPDGKEFASSTLYSDKLMIWNTAALNIAQIEDEKLETLDKPDIKKRRQPEIEWVGDQNIETDVPTYRAQFKIISGYIIDNLVVSLNDEKFSEESDLIISGNQWTERDIVLYLNEGMNTVKVNMYFRDKTVSSKVLSINYQVQEPEPEPLPEPEIAWLSAEKIATEDEEFVLEYKIKSAYTPENLKLYVNNKPATKIMDFDFSADEWITNNFSSKLEEGNNEFMIKLKYTEGEVTTDKLIVFREVIVEEIPEEIIVQVPEIVEIEELVTPEEVIAEAVVVETEPEEKETLIEKDSVAEKIIKDKVPEAQPEKETDFNSELIAGLEIKAKSNPYRFALIIGNEDYSSYQVGLRTESNVDYAVNDAKAFREYAIRVFGVPEDNILFLTNARAIEMDNEIQKLRNIIRALNGRAEVIFYYAGHGFPDEQTKEPHIMPVDVTGTNLKFAVKLADLYKAFTEFPTKSVTVFMDACFSGGARNVGLVSARGVRVRPRENQLEGNLIVFSASSESQSSHPYHDKQHGIFTYFLLDKLRETEGEISYKDLSEYIVETVGVRAAIINNTEQTPQVNVSPNIDQNWIEWRIK